MSEEPEINGLDEFMNDQQPMVVGITPENVPRPAFTLTRMPPRTRTKTMMRAQYDGEGTEKKLIGFKPVEESETVYGGYMLRAMKGHSVFIESLDELKRLKLDRYVKMISPSDPDGNAVAHVPVSNVTRPARKAA